MTFADDRYPVVFDGHNDTLLDLFQRKGNDGRSFFNKSGVGHIDLPRAIEGGFGGGFFAMFVTAKSEDQENDQADGSGSPDSVQTLSEPLVENDYANEFTLNLLNLLKQLEGEAEGRLRIVHSVSDIRDCLSEGVMAAVIHIEGAEAIKQDLSNLEHYYGEGLRSLGITWSRSNAFGHGVPFVFPGSPDTGPGLTPAGKSLVRQCGKLGIMIDLSHLNEQGFWDVAELTPAPLVATHSGAHKLCPSTRNLTDRQIDAIGESDGIIGVNFHVGFLCKDGQQKQDVSLVEIVKHVDYIAERIGIDHVALGSDFDGARMPADLGDVTGLPRLLEALYSHGHDKESVRKIAHENWMRVLRETWK